MRKDILKNAGVISVIAAVYAAGAAVGIGCPIKFFTGISCAGCGMTRAWQSVIRLDISKAFEYHPLFWTVPVAAALIMARKRMGARLYNLIFIVLIAMFLTVYLIRMLDPSDSVVTFNISDGAYMRLFNFIKNRICGGIV